MKSAVGCCQVRYGAEYGLERCRPYGDATGQSDVEDAAALSEDGFRETVHLSQQNTFTGKLTPAMLRDVLEQAKELGRPWSGRVGRAVFADERSAVWLWRAALALGHSGARLRRMLSPVFRTHYVSEA